MCSSHGRVHSCSFRFLRFGFCLCLGEHALHVVCVRRVRSQAIASFLEQYYSPGDLQEFFALFQNTSKGRTVRLLIPVCCVRRAFVCLA